MPRTPEEIQAEMKRLKAEGVHHASKPFRALRAELEAAGGAPRPSEPKRKRKASKGRREAFKPAPLPMEVTVEPAQPVEIPSRARVEEDVFDTDEWRFIERCCVEFSLEMRGVNSSMTKKACDIISIKVKVWRLMRGLFKDLGPGAELPQYADLGLDPTFGRPIKPKQQDNGKVEAPVEEEAPAMTDAQMPVRSKPSREALLEQLGGKSRFDPRMAP